MEGGAISTTGRRSTTRPCNLSRAQTHPAALRCALTSGLRSATGQIHCDEILGDIAVQAGNLTAESVVAAACPRSRHHRRHRAVFVVSPQSSTSTQAPQAAHDRPGSDRRRGCASPRRSTSFAGLAWSAARPAPPGSGRGCRSDRCRQGEVLPRSTGRRGCVAYADARRRDKERVTDWSPAERGGRARGVAAIQRDRAMNIDPLFVDVYAGDYRPPAYASERRASSGRPATATVSTSGTALTTTSTWRSTAPRRPTTSSPRSTAAEPAASGRASCGDGRCRARRPARQGPEPAFVEDRTSSFAARYTALTGRWRLTAASCCGRWGSRRGSTAGDRRSR